MGYYSGDATDVMTFCKSLDIGEDRLASVSGSDVEKYQKLVDAAIDGYLSEYYFLPIIPYSQMQTDGTVAKVFPGMIRMIALQWTAGLMLQSEFQQVEPNISEHAKNLIDDSKREMQHIVDYSVRIPGQRRKHPSPTMPPSLAPSKTNELLI